MTATYDAVVIGGGLVGSAVAYGLADAGLSVAVLDEGDVAYRASRGNFGLVWVQSKGDGMAAYADWTRSSADRWPAFAATLSAELGLDIGYRKPGGVHLCLNDAEFEGRRNLLWRLHNQAGSGGFDYRLLDRQALHELLPGLGETVVGGSYCPHDGHVSPLYLLRALHHGLRRRHAGYRPNHQVERIERDGAGFAVTSGRERFLASRVVLAAGLGSRELGPQVGLHIPIHPLKGQILVTERARPFLDRPTTFVRQTGEGSVLLGDSQEDAGFNLTATTDVMSAIAARAVASFPVLKSLSVVRAWAALRIMTPDGGPIYDESDSHPGAFAITCHSGVTLAAAHALRLAPAIADGSLRTLCAPFSSKRFHVQTT